MSYFTYIIQSKTNLGFYIGSSDNPLLRLQRHNDGWTRSTKNRGPWELVYTKKFNSKSEAIKFEKEIKRKKSRKFIEALIMNAGGRPDS